MKGNVLVAIDRARRYVIIRQLHIRTAQVTAQALREILEEFPYPVHTIMTDNDGSFTDKYAIYKIGKPKRQPSGSHLFDVVCKEYGIKHKLITPYRPQTNSMVERFNRRIGSTASSTATATCGHPENCKSTYKELCDIFKPIHCIKKVKFSKNCHSTYYDYLNIEVFHNLPQLKFIFFLMYLYNEPFCKEQLNSCSL